MANSLIKSYLDLKIYLEDKSIKKIFIICGAKSIKELKFKEKIIGFKLNKEISYYAKTNPYPEFEELIKICIEAEKIKPDLIIAVGGGSVIDYAKIVSVLDLNEDNLKEKIILNNIGFKKKYKVLAIPTTAGSGAEVTSNAVIYLERNKYSLENKNIRPDDFLLIPDLVNIGTSKIKASAGFDAISQAIESIISMKSNSLSYDFALKSLKISIANYIDYLKSPSSDNTFNMCLSANLAGEAINISKTTAPHAVSYPFTSYFGISHGHAVALNLSKFLKFNYENLLKSKAEFNLQERYKSIFNVTNTKSINELCALIENLANKANLELNYAKLGININENMNLILDGINSQRLKNNPVEISVNELKKIIL